MEEENQLYNPNANINRKKVLIILDKIIYPKSLKEIINGMDFKKKEFEFNLFLKDSYVWVISLHDTNEKRLDLITKEIRNEFCNQFSKGGVIHFNGTEFIEELSNLKEKINNGIPERLFNEWFMNLAIHLSKMKHPLDNSGKIKKKYLPGSHIVSFKYKVDNLPIVYSNYLFISSDGTMLSKPYINELAKKSEKEANEKLFNTEKKKKISKRNPLDSKLRHEVFKRDGYKCLECGATNKEKTLHCDHIIPVAQNGTDEMDNLQTLCDDCNLAKSDKCWKGNLNEVENGKTKAI